jgi:multidrug efflux pump subunit AcrB
MKDNTRKNKLLEVIREFGLSSWAVNNRTTVFFITFIILVIGGYSYKMMPKEAFPEVVMPQIMVTTPYPGNSTENIEKFITKPLEKEINSVDGVKKILSNSMQDYSMLMIEFQPSIEVAQALQDVKDAVDKAKAQKDWPTDLDTDPAVSDVNMSDFPIMFINLSGDYQPEQLKEYAEDFNTKLKS